MSLYNRNSSGNHRSYPFRSEYDFTGGLFSGIIECKIRTAFADNNKRIATYHSGTNGPAMWIVASADETPFNRFRFNVRTAAGSAHAKDQTARTAGLWYSVGFRQAASSISIFVDGKLEQTTAIAAYVGGETQPIRLFQTASGSFTGDVELRNLCVWNTDLSDGEFHALARGADPRHVRRSNQVIRDRLDLGSRDEIFNNGRDTGTLVSPEPGRQAPGSRIWVSGPRRGVKAGASAPPSVNANFFFAAA